MQFNHLINQRFSVRKYKETPVEDDKLMLVLDAGRLAPSAANLQPWHFIIIREPDNLRKIKAVYHREWTKEAPVIIIVCADHSVSWKRGSDGKDFSDVDIAIAVDHMTLQAAELGIGTCWICNFNTRACTQLLDLPDHIEPLVMLPLGYPDEPVKAKQRKSLDETVHWENFNVARR